MTDKYTNYTKRQEQFAATVNTVAPLTCEEKAELKARILLALNRGMA